MRYGDDAIISAPEGLGWELRRSAWLSPDRPARHRDWLRATALLSFPFLISAYAALASIGFASSVSRRGAGVVERGSLENCWRRKALVGSNPTPSASPERKPYWG